MRAVSILEIVTMNFQFFSITFSLPLAWPDQWKGWLQFMNIFRLDLSWLIIDDIADDDRSYFMIISLALPLFITSLMILLFRRNYENIVFVFVLLSVGMYSYNQQYVDDVGVYGFKSMFFSTSSNLRDTYSSFQTISIIGLFLSAAAIVYQLNRLYKLVRLEVIRSKTITETENLESSTYASKKNWKFQLVNLLTWIALLIIRYNITLPDYVVTVLVLLIVIMSYLVLTNFNIKIGGKNYEFRFLDVNWNQFNYRNGDRIRSYTLYLIIFFLGFIYIPISEYALRMFQCVDFQALGFYIPKSVKMNLKDYIYSQNQVHTPLMNCTQLPLSQCSVAAYNITCNNYSSKMLVNIRGLKNELDCSFEAQKYGLSAFAAILAITVALPFMYYVLIVMTVNIIKKVKHDPEIENEWDTKMEHVHTSTSALFNMFIYKCRYTKILFLIQRLLFVVVAVYVQVESSPFVLLVIQLVALACYIHIKPYRQHLENTLAISLTTAQVVNLLLIGIAANGAMSDAILVIAAIVIFAAPALTFAYGMRLQYKQRQNLMKEKANLEEVLTNKQEISIILSFKEWFKDQFGLEKDQSLNTNVKGLMVTKKELGEYTRSSNKRLLSVLNNFFLLISVILAMGLGIALGNFYHYFRNAIRTDRITVPYTGAQYVDEYTPVVVSRSFPNDILDQKIASEKIAINATYYSTYATIYSGDWRRGCCCSIESDGQTYKQNGFTMNMTFENWRCDVNLMAPQFLWRNGTGGNLLDFSETKKNKIVQEVISILIKRLLREATLYDVDGSVISRMNGTWIRGMCSEVVKVPCLIKQTLSLRHPYASCPGYDNYAGEGEYSLQYLMNPENQRINQLKKEIAPYLAKMTYESLYMW
eukprot:NODE_10_length_47437_cov_0.363429.p3 type:complete len:871 gc:universal NODE_10_length_47437_cov_0.363429:39722-37110(-)